ncbi:unnamed protein product [Chrysoparadoxa australica]
MRLLRRLAHTKASRGGGLAYLKKWANIGESTSAASARGQQQHRVPRPSPGLAAVSLVGRSYLIPTLRLERNDTPETLRSKLHEKMVVHQGMFFKNSPLVLDLADVSQNGSPHAQLLTAEVLSGVLEVIREVQLVPVGVLNACPHVLAIAQSKGIASLMLAQGRSMAHALPTVHSDEAEPHSLNAASDSRADEVTTGETQSTVAEAESTIGETQMSQSAASSEVSRGNSKDVGEHKGAGECFEAMICNGNVRSGQQVYAEGRSLVVMGSVNALGEVLSDGDIHIYGALKGKALAGLSGNPQARIFATSFDAELVGIGDVVNTCEDVDGGDERKGLVIGGATCVSVAAKGGGLEFKAIDLA